MAGEPEAVPPVSLTRAEGRQEILTGGLLPDSGSKRSRARFCARFYPWCACSADGGGYDIRNDIIIVPKGGR
jgi:hypothetical protein